MSRPAFPDLAFVMQKTRPRRESRSFGGQHGWLAPILSREGYQRRGRWGGGTGGGGAVFFGGGGGGVDYIIVSSGASR